MTPFYQELVLFFGSMVSLIHVLITMYSLTPLYQQKMNPTTFLRRSCSTYSFSLSGSISVVHTTARQPFFRASISMYFSSLE